MFWGAPLKMFFVKEYVGDWSKFFHTCKLLYVLDTFSAGLSWHAHPTYVKVMVMILKVLTGNTCS